MQRSILIFENSIKSDATQKTYLYHLSKFMKFFQIPDYDKLASIPTEKMQIMVEDYVMDLKKKLSPNSLNLPISALKAFLDCNDVELRWGKIKRLLPARVKKTGSEAWTTDEISQMLSFTKEIRTKALIHFLSATGVRIGALDGLELRHLVPINDCKSVLVYENSVEEYTTFLTSEASLVLDDYFNQRKNDGETLGPDSPVFRSAYQLGIAKTKSASTHSLKEIIRTLILKSGLRTNQTKIGNRYNKQADHGFRKRFNTILKTTDSVNISLSEKMMGHSVSVSLDSVYLVPTVKQLFKEYKKAIPQLIINDSTRNQIELEQVLKENSELERKNKELLEYKTKVDQLWNEMQRRDHIEMKSTL